VETARKGWGIFDSWTTKNLKRDLNVKIRGVAHTRYEKAGQASDPLPPPPEGPNPWHGQTGSEFSHSVWEGLEEGKSGYWWFGAGRGPRGLNNMVVVPTASGEESGFQSLPPSWRQNWGLVAEETGGGAEILRECGFRSQDNNYPGRELGRGLILNFAGRVLVEGRGAGRRKKGGKPCQGSCRVACRGRAEMAQAK
jgi:hypothetical protein